MQMPSGLDDFDAFVYLPGNDYRRSMVQQFMTYLWHATGKRVIFVQLLENKSEHYDYDALEPKPYSDYIARSIGRPGKYVMMGISMGCLHIANFAHFYPQWCHRCMFMFEPTIMQGIYPLLYDFEDGRGNGEWLADLKEQPNNLDIPANEKVMDISIDRHYEIPESVQRIGVIYTTRSNRQVIANLRWLARQEMQGKVTIRLPHIPDYNTPHDIKQSRQLLEDMGYSQFDEFEYQTPNH